MDLNALTQQAAAMLAGVTARTLRDWEKAGESVPRNADGTYPGPALVQFLLRRVAGDALDPVRERARKDKESADKLAMENADRRGETVLTAVVVEEMGGYIGTCCTRLREIGGKTASEFDPATGRRVESIVDREVEYAIAELREYRPRVVGRARSPLDA